MSNLKFTEAHDWLRLEDDGIVTIGITDYAQEQLGDIVYVELPNVGEMLSAGSEAVVIESVKAADEIKTAIGGEVVEVNDTLEEKPETVNFDPVGNGWFFKLAPDDVGELEQFMEDDAYQEFIRDL